MNQVHLMDVTLEELIAQSDYIIIADKLKPFATKEKVKIKTKKKMPPFYKWSYHYKVQEILKQQNSELKIGDKIIIDEANWQNNLTQHKLFYIENVAESPIYMSYLSGLNLNELSPVILFLYNNKNKYQITMIGAYESINKKDKIISIIKNNQ